MNDRAKIPDPPAEWSRGIDYRNELEFARFSRVSYLDAADVRSRDPNVNPDYPHLFAEELGPKRWLQIAHKNENDTAELANDKQKRVGRLFALCALLALPLLAACQSTQTIGRVVTPSIIQPSDPPLNPDPTHIVRLYGRAPETLDFRFRIGFVTTSREGDCYNHAGFWEGGGEKGWGYDLYPVRKGEDWEADLVVDRYLPGRCGWNIKGSAMILVEPLDAQEGDSLGAGMRLVVTDARGWDDEAPRCEPRNPRCSEERSRLLSNSNDAIPVQVICKRIPPEKRIGDTSFICNEFPEHKTRHRLKESTERIHIDLYDLDHEDVPIDSVIDDDKEVSHE